jgi:putative membrane protein
MRSDTVLNTNERQIRTINLVVLIGIALMMMVAIYSYEAEATPVDTQDSTFASKAAAGGTAQVELGKLAQQTGSIELVQSFGQRMVADYTAAGTQLKNAAQKENTILPLDMSSEDRALYDRLSQLSGPAFDKEYARAMVKGHEQVLAEFEQEVTNGKNETIKQFAVQTLPIIMQHLKLAREMEKAASGTDK